MHQCKDGLYAVQCTVYSVQYTLYSVLANGYGKLCVYY